MAGEECWNAQMTAVQQLQGGSNGPTRAVTVRVGSREYFFPEAILGAATDQLRLSSGAYVGIDDLADVLPAILAVFDAQLQAPVTESP